MQQNKQKIDSDFNLTNRKIIFIKMLTIVNHQVNL